MVTPPNALSQVVSYSVAGEGKPTIGLKALKNTRIDGWRSRRIAEVTVTRHCRMPTCLRKRRGYILTAALLPRSGFISLTAAAAILM